MLGLRTIYLHDGRFTTISNAKYNKMAKDKEFSMAELKNTEGIMVEILFNNVNRKPDELIKIFLGKVNFDKNGIYRHDESDLLVFDLNEMKPKRIILSDEERKLIENFVHEKMSTLKYSGEIIDYY